MIIIIFHYVQYFSESSQRHMKCLQMLLVVSPSSLTQHYHEVYLLEYFQKISPLPESPLHGPTLFLIKAHICGEFSRHF